MSDAIEQARLEAEALARKSAPVTEQPVAAGSSVTAAPALDQAALDRAEAAAWASLPSMFGSVLCLAMPELREAYSEKNCAAWGDAFVPLARQHGWTFAAMGPLMGVLAASVPMLVPTIAAIKLRRAGVEASIGKPAAASSSAGAVDEAALQAAALERAARRRAEGDAPADATARAVTA